MKLHQAYLVTCLEGKDGWKHPHSFSLGIGADVDVGYKEYDLRCSNLYNACVPCQVCSHRRAPACISWPCCLRADC